MTCLAAADTDETRDLIDSPPHREGAGRLNVATETEIRPDGVGSSRRGGITHRTERRIDASGADS